MGGRRARDVRVRTGSSAASFTGTSPPPLSPPRKGEGGTLRSMIILVFSSLLWGIALGLLAMDLELNAQGLGVWLDRAAS